MLALLFFWLLRRLPDGGYATVAENSWRSASAAAGLRIDEHRAARHPAGRLRRLDLVSLERSQPASRRTSKVTG